MKPNDQCRCSTSLPKPYIYKRHRQTGGGRRTGEWSDDNHTSLCLLDGSVLGYRLFLRPRLPAASPFGIGVFVSLSPCCSCRCDGKEGDRVPSDSYAFLVPSRSAADPSLFFPFSTLCDNRKPHRRLLPPLPPLLLHQRLLSPRTSTISATSSPVWLSWRSLPTPKKRNKTLATRASYKLLLRVS